MKREYLQPDDLRVSLVGDSMVPMLAAGDILWLTPCAPSAVTRGDIVARWNNGIITHRVIEINRDRIYTKGDARYWMDPIVDPKDLIGKVIFVNRREKFIDMESPRWKIVNQLLGFIGWIQVKSVWGEQLGGKSSNGKNWLHRISFWMGKQLIWVILFLFGRNWVRRTSFG